MDHLFGDVKGQLNKLTPPKQMEQAQQYYDEQSTEIHAAFAGSGTIHTVKIMLFEYAKKKDERINELEEKNKELHDLCSLVYHSFGGGLTMTFNEAQVELFREATGN